MAKMSGKVLGIYIAEKVGEPMEEKTKAVEELPICPCCEGLKYWPFADVAYGMPCPICREAGRVDPKVAIERGC